MSQLRQWSHKVCPACKVERPITMYHADRSRPDKLQRYCTRCNVDMKRKERERQVEFHELRLDRKMQKRVWEREDEHYRMPGGFGLSPSKRLCIFNEHNQMSPNCLATMYREQLVTNGLPDDATHQNSLLKLLGDDNAMQMQLVAAVAQFHARSTFGCCAR